MLQVIKAEEVRDGERCGLFRTMARAMDAIADLKHEPRPLLLWDQPMPVSEFPYAIVDRPAPTPTPAPGLDLDTAEKRAAGFRGRFRVMAYDSGDELLEFVALDAYNCDESEIDGGDLDEIAQFACDDTVQRAIVDTLNEAPALIAEVRALRRHYDAAGPDHNLLALLDLYHEREQAALAKLAEAKRLGLEACEYYADAPDLHDPACASLDQRGACDCTAGIAAALEAL